MRTFLLTTLLAASGLPALQAQQVRLAKVGLGMSEAELKQVLGGTPRYTNCTSPFPGTHSLLAVTEEESYLFTLTNDKVVAFSLVHLIPAGQQPSLPSGQEPSVKILRDLVIKQTWAPVSVNAGDTYWLSDAHGGALSSPDSCKPKGSVAWKPLAVQPSDKGQAVIGLKEPVITDYPANCGVSIHLKEDPAATENERVSKVEIQVVDLRAMSALVAPKH